MNLGLSSGRSAADLIGPLFALAMVAAACSAGVGSRDTSVPDPTVVATLQPGSPDVSVPASPTLAAAPTNEAGVPVASPPQYPWLAMDLRDVRTGEIVRPADLAGKLIVIEPMAAWCSNCRAQQNEVHTALLNLAGADLVYISLDVDPNETDEDLARYANDLGYPWHFAVASRDLARALAATFGDTVLSPPSTPKIVIAPGGTAEVTFGIKSAADLEAELAALLP